MIINDKSEIIAIKITKGNYDDRKAFEEMAIKKDLKGKVYADKGGTFLKNYLIGFILLGYKLLLV